MEKNILIISHLAINNTNNVGKTLLQLFNKFSEVHLSQLYFHPTSPNVNKCKYWYKITDEQVISSYYGKKAGGEYIYVEDTIEEKSQFYNKNIGKTSVKLLLRDIVWKFGRIDWIKLSAWLEKVNPDVIFLAPGYSVFVYRIALKISKLRKIPIVLFVMDDYFNENKNKYSLIEKIRLTWLRSIIKKIIELSSCVVTVSQEMAKDYSNYFGIQTEVIYTPYEKKKESIIKDKTNLKDLQFIYAGSLGLNRWKVIYNIGEFLQKNYPNSIITIYASSDYKDIIDQLVRIKNINYGGFISADDLQNKVQKADVIVHAESFDEVSFNRTRYSISTKIPECLASNKIFLAIGPKNQASISYLNDNKAALVCTSEEEMENTLVQLLEGKIDYSSYRENAQKLLAENHNPAVMYEFLCNLFNKVN